MGGEWGERDDDEATVRTLVVAAALEQWGEDTRVATTAAAASTASTMLGTSREVPSRQKDGGRASRSGTTGSTGSETLVGNEGNDST